MHEQRFIDHVLTYILSISLGYLIGSIPTAFLLVRWKSNVDIRSVGSGNVGALNSFQVTRSRFVGAMVLMLDMLKGVSAVLFVTMLFGQAFSIQAVAGVAAVAGHNFPVWLKFKGGKGLATAAGVMFALSWVFVLIWAAFWAIGFVLTRHVNAGNTFASAAELVGILVASASVLSWLLAPSIPTDEFRWFALPLFAVILVKHIDPMRQYFDRLKTPKA